MEDVSPKILKAIKEDFDELYASNYKIKRYLKMADEGTATLIDAQKYASEVGAILAKAYQFNLVEGVLPDDRLYWNIANKIVDPMVRQNHRLVNEIASKVQLAIDKAKGIGLKPIAPKLNEERLKGLKDNACVIDIPLSEVRKRLNEPVRNFTESMFDEFVKTNATFRAESGLYTYIIRRAEPKCCEWCSKLDGVYKYGEEPHEVYQRHENCRCITTYEADKYSQNVWSKEKTGR